MESLLIMVFHLTVLFMIFLFPVLKLWKHFEFLPLPCTCLTSNHWPGSVSCPLIPNFILFSPHSSSSGLWHYSELLKQHDWSLSYLQSVKHCYRVKLLPPDPHPSNDVDKLLYWVSSDFLIVFGFISLMLSDLVPSTTQSIFFSNAAPLVFYVFFFQLNWFDHLY